MREHVQWKDTAARVVRRNRTRRGQSVILPLLTTSAHSSATSVKMKLAPETMTSTAVGWLNPTLANSVPEYWAGRVEAAELLGYLEVTSDNYVTIFSVAAFHSA